MRYNEIIIDQGYSDFNPVVFGYEKCEPNHDYGPAIRSYWLLHYVVAGTGCFEREGKEYYVNQGEIFVIPPYLETYYKADAKKPWEYIWIGFTASEKFLPFSAPILRCPRAGEIFGAMKLCGQMEKGRSAYLTAKLWELMALLAEQNEKETGYIEKAIHCIHSEYMTDLTVQSLAARLNLDRSYFSTLFKKEVGRSPSQYLIEVRMKKAAELMVQHKKSITTAGLSVGYPDLYHFSKAFKAHYGVSPRIYLKNK